MPESRSTNEFFTIIIPVVSSGYYGQSWPEPEDTHIVRELRLIVFVFFRVYGNLRDPSFILHI